MLTAGLRCAPDTLPMKRMIAITMSPGATTAAVRLIVPGNAWPIIPPPAATSTRKNVPSNSENNRRHSCDESWKSSTACPNDSTWCPMNPDAASNAESLPDVLVIATVKRTRRGAVITQRG